MLGSVICYGLFVMVCEPQVQPVVSDSYCSIAKPIYFSKNDTRETKEAVDIHNRQWKRVCRPRSDKNG